MEFKRSNSGRVLVPSEDGIKNYRPEDLKKYKRYRDRWRPKCLITLGATPVAKFQTSISPFITITVSTGNTLVVGIEIFSATITITNITCTSESNLTPIGSRTVNATLAEEAQMAYLSKITAGGSKTITFNLSASIGVEMWAYELVGADTTGALDVNNGSTGNNTSPQTTLTTTVANDCIIATAATANSPTSGSGYTQPTVSPVNNNWFESTEYNLNVGAAGSNTPNMTITTGQWLFVAAAFKPASSFSFWDTPYTPESTRSIIIPIS